MRKLLASPIVSALLLVAGLGLIVFGGINGAAAAPRIQSADYRAQAELTNIETALTENGVIVEGDDALLGYDRFLQPNGLAQKDADGYVENFHIGQTYDEVLSVRNVGTIDQYVRVTVRVYWTDGKGKQITLDPKLIDLHFIEGPGANGEGWTIDTKASTAERTVLYYSDPIAPGEDTNPFTDTITISGEVMTAVTQAADGTNSFDYTDMHCAIDATVDAVQTHNAEDAMTSAWGRTNEE